MRTPLSRPRPTVFVDIPPSPLTSLKNKPSAAFLKSVPVVEIPAATFDTKLKKSKNTTKMVASSSQPSRTFSKVEVVIPSRPRPLGEANSNAKLREDTAGKKRRADAPIEADTVKKPRKEQAQVIQTDPPAPVAPAEHRPVKQVIRKPRVKVPPQPPTWTAISGSLSKTYIEDRILIREFFNRFAALCKFPKNHVELLDNFASLQDMTVKNMLIALVDLVLADAAEETRESLRQAKAQLRKGGVNFTKMLSIMTELGQSAPSLSFTIPESASSSSMRSKKVRDTTANDILPTILSLIEVVLAGPSIRDDITQGMEEAKQIRSAMDEKIRTEKERWEKEKASLKEFRDDALAAEEKASEAGDPRLTNPENKFSQKEWREEYRAAEAKHKSKLRILQLTLLQKLSPNQLRFTPAGSDYDGRVYYFLSFPPKSAKPPSEEDRPLLERWSWFLATWSPDAVDSNAVYAGSWSALHEFTEIRKLIQWLDWRRTELELAEQGPPPDGSVVATFKVAGREHKGGQIKSLVKNLNDFADFLEWQTEGKVTA